MTRTINVKVTGQFVQKDSKNAGVMGEGNVTTLSLTMDESWSGYGKRIVWRDASGENPVALVLVPPAQAGEAGGLSADTLIPAEPLALPGWCSFTLEGYKETDGVHAVALSVSDRLFVAPSDSYYQPAEPTPSQGQQILEAIGKNEAVVTAAAQEARAAAQTAVEKADAAAQSQAAAARSQAAAAQSQAAAAASSANAAAAELSAKSWAVGGTGTRLGENTDNAKYYAQLASAVAQGGVLSFNARGGHVLPQSGDYTNDMIDGSLRAAAQRSYNGG